ncbi:acyl-CoA dehydrogenase family protein [Nocardia vaccinii]|uniref:acyl-CoA dehydrogenase family protein n=1 Tax=Nocardia vaccinii TaxID=1822 RepID=UPI000832912B|nr:acyl-CoA dehydrogenase family protein [Nocardia vaccinii]
MDFTFNEQQQTIAKLAGQLFEQRATPERLTELESGGNRHDPALWSDLAKADLLGVGLTESVGGSGGGFLELGVLLAAVGGNVAPVPVYATLLLGADTIARHGTEAQQQEYLPAVVEGTYLLSAALAEPRRSDPTAPATTARRDGDGWRLDGAKELVPAATVADAVIVPARTDEGAALFIVDTAADGVELTPVRTTNGEPHADLSFHGVRLGPSDRLGSEDSGTALIADLHTRAMAGLCAIQLGVAERALTMAAAYTGGRVQFGRPIGTFQAVQQRMADAFIDVEAMRWTTWHAAWLIDNGRPANREAHIAKFWAAEAGARVTATAQQVHGGMGIDITYPLSRYFLWAKHNELTLGSSTAHLAYLGGTFTEGNQ